MRDCSVFRPVGGLDLAASGVTTSMVYWADVMYLEPEPVGTNFESVDDGLGLDMHKLNGKSGTYPANEGLYFQNILDAVAESFRAS